LTIALIVAISFVLAYRVASNNSESKDSLYSSNQLRNSNYSQVGNSNSRDTEAYGHDDEYQNDTEDTDYQNEYKEEEAIKEESTDNSADDDTITASSGGVKDDATDAEHEGTTTLDKGDGTLEHDTLTVNEEEFSSTADNDETPTSPTPPDTVLRTAEDETAALPASEVDTTEGAAADLTEAESEINSDIATEGTDSLTNDGGEETATDEAGNQETETDNDDVVSDELESDAANDNSKRDATAQNHDTGRL
jgi:hypothetical protein